MTDTVASTEPSVADEAAASKEEAPKARTRSAAVAAASKPKAGQVVATLKKGDNYAVRFEGKTHRFFGGQPKAISPALHAYLEETAVDAVTVTEGDDTASTETRQKFQFASV